MYVYVCIYATYYSVLDGTLAKKIANEEEGSSLGLCVCVHVYRCRCNHFCTDIHLKLVLDTKFAGSYIRTT